MLAARPTRPLAPAGRGRGRLRPRTDVPSAPAAPARQPARNSRRGSPPRATGPGKGASGDGDEGVPDSSIDELAALLSRRAAEMRASSGASSLDDLLPVDEDSGGGGGEEGGEKGATGAGDAQGPPVPSSGASSSELGATPAAAGAPPPPPPQPHPQQRPRRTYSGPVAMPPNGNGFVSTDFQVFKTLGQLGVVSD
jgi:hypothetical protein